jgi:acetoin utilization protein AcuB
MSIASADRMKESAILLEDIMTKSVRAIGPEATLDDARALMRETGIHHLVVIKAGHIAGVISSRDCDRVHEAAQSDDRWTVEELMTSRVIVASPDTTVGEAARLLRGYTIGCVPVVDGKELVGIVTTSDLLDLLGEKPRRRSGPDPQLIRS